MRVIDAHLHVWDLDRADYPWLGPQLAPIDVSHDVADVREDLRHAAAEPPQVYAKVSGLYPPGPAAAWTAWTRDDLRPVVEAALDIFGPDRLMLGRVLWLGRRG